LAMPRVRGLLKGLEVLKRQVLQRASRRRATAEELPNRVMPERQGLPKPESRRQKAK